MKTLLLLGVGCGLLCGCAGTGALDCTPANRRIVVNPVSATADHAAASPGNSVQFQASFRADVPKGCSLPPYAAFLLAAWTSADPLDVPVDGTPTPANGTATCQNATSGPVTLTAVYGAGSSALTATSTIACK